MRWLSLDALPARSPQAGDRGSSTTLAMGILDRLSPASRRDEPSSAESCEGRRNAHGCCRSNSPGQLFWRCGKSIALAERMGVYSISDLLEASYQCRPLSPRTLSVFEHAQIVPVTTSG
jgi:hypothetical protein